MENSMVDWEWKYHRSQWHGKKWKIKERLNFHLTSSMTKNTNNFQLISQITVTNAEKTGDCLQLL